MTEKLSWMQKTIKISELKDYEKNPRKINKDDFERLVRDLKQDGYHGRILVNQDNTIIGGHQRKKALIKAGFKQSDEIEVLYPSRKLSDEEFKRINIRDNLPFGEYDFDILANEFDHDQLIEWGMPEEWLNFDNEEIKDGQTDDDAVPPLAEEPITILDDIWLLDNHRLICGDCTCVNTVEKLMAGSKADILFTSPPYNIGKKGYEKKGKYENFADNSDQEWLNLLNDFLALWMQFSHYQFVNLQILAGNKIKLHEWLYQYRNYYVDQFALVKTKCPAMEENILNSDLEFVYIFKNHLNPKRHINLGKKFRGTISNIYHMKRSKGELSDIHRATFDVSLPLFFIESFLSKNGVVADPFGGTGTTLIACEKTNRKCYMMELHPRYCDVIVKRWQDFTGKQAILESTKQTFDELVKTRAKRDNGSPKQSKKSQDV